MYSPILDKGRPHSPIENGQVGPNYRIYTSIRLNRTRPKAWARATISLIGCLFRIGQTCNGKDTEPHQPISAHAIARVLFDQVQG